MGLYNDISQPPPPLPSTDLRQVAQGITSLSPLTRRGHGPGIILLTPEIEQPVRVVDGVPSLPQKWAEEGYTVVTIQPSALTDPSNAASVLKSALESLSSHEKCQPKEKVGIVSYNTTLWNAITQVLPSFREIVAAAVYEVDGKPHAANIPVLLHSVSDDPEKVEGERNEHLVKETKLFAKTYRYQASSGFAIPHGEAWQYNTEALSHTRNLQFLKPKMDGPYFDLETIWDEHCYYEFADRSVEHTMSTMVEEPYVNHVPVLTGGIGRTKLTQFYAHNFIFNNSADTALELLSRTLGIDRIIDEFIFKFTHDKELDWLLPGIPPTNLKVEVPFTAVVNVRGDRLYHEHIGWDQGTVLKQLGLLPEYLPWPYEMPESVNSNGTPDYAKNTNGANGANGVNGANGTNGHTNGSNGTNGVNGAGKKWEFRVPVAGIESAQKMRDRNSVKSNQMFDWKPRLAQ